MRWSGILTGYSTFFLSHDKKDRFAEFGKSSQDKRFVFMWAITPPFATFSHTSILCITSKCIKNESTTAKPKMTFLSMSRKWSIPCRSEQRKKTSVMT